MKKTASKKGFSLIEILITIAIAGVLVALVVPNLLTARTQADAGMADALQNQLNTVHSQWVAMGGVTDAAPGDTNDLGLSVLTVLTSSGFQGDGTVANASNGAEDGVSSSDAINSSSIRMSLNDGTPTQANSGDPIIYSNFSITFDGSAFAVAAR